MDIKSLARSYSEEAVSTLAGIARKSPNDAARVAAAQALLDRGWGKCAQPVTGADGESGIEITMRNIMEGKP